jgi:hypothetical protein
MLRVVRHNLRVIVRLAALFILLGLATVPVECASVYGPHSVFVNAESVATLRAAAAVPGEQAAGAHHVHMGQSPATHAGHQGAVLSSPAAQESEQGAPADLPETAGATTEALIALALVDTQAGLAADTQLPPLLLAPQPARDLLSGPEPPPPQQASSPNL